jgi:SAM-dependent methyltransferase
MHNFYAHLHDTELWAGYLPSVPRPLRGLAVFGLFVAVATVLLPDDRLAPFRLLSLVSGLLLCLPALLVWSISWRQSNYRLARRKKLLDRIVWRGDEQVLDVGCGSGVMLNGAARRVPRGRAVGIDIWAAHSGGGSLALLLRNAKAEGVSERIEFREADARQMPFASASFDVVLCSGALHHIVNGFEQHAQVIGEMVRVLKPGGYIAIYDVTHMVEATAARLRQAGVECAVTDEGRMLHFEMSALAGRKP